MRSYSCKFYRKIFCKPAFLVSGTIGSQLLEYHPEMDVLLDRTLPIREPQRVRLKIGGCIRSQIDDKIALHCPNVLPFPPVLWTLASKPLSLGTEINRNINELETFHPLTLMTSCLTKVLTQCQNIDFPYKFLYSSINIYKFNE